MADVKVKLNRAAVRSLLKSPEVAADLERRARAIASAAGGEPDYEVDSRIGSNRARASARTATFDAMLAESRSQPLLRAVDAGRS